MIKILGILFISLIFGNISYAKHRSFCTPMLEINDPPWEDPLLHDDPFAPWNSSLNLILVPWHSTSLTCSKSSINEYLKQNNYPKKYFWK